MAGAGAELDDDVSVLETAGREVQTGGETRTCDPAGVEDAPLPGTRGLHPAECLRSFATVVGGEEKVPDPQARYGADNVND